MKELRVTNVRFSSDVVKQLHTISELRCREDDAQGHKFTIWPKQKVYDALVSGDYRFYTEVNGYTADLEPVNDERGQYVKTKPDSIGIDNLLSLPGF